MADTESQSIYRNLAYYSECFSNLQVYLGKALNKPILILSVIDLIAQDIIQENRIFITDELIESFRKYWEILEKGKFKSSDFALPFFHLKNETGKFWHLKFSDRYEGGRPQSIPKIKHDVDFASLDDELFSILEDPESRTELIDVLVDTWFSAKQNKLEEILNINQELQDYVSEQEDSKNLQLENERDRQEKKYSFRRSLIRDAFFRKSIIHIYDYRCALCRLKVMRSLSQTIVDGAHIKPYGRFYDNKINNGLSLCKNHHWAFDKGWFSIDDDYKIIVTNDLQEDSPYARPISDFVGEAIILPNSQKYFPSLDALSWHRVNIFKS
ncbi:HNH endonuclease [Oxynema aestuarii]|uniref:HNH endonuclease n=1 Tax=Oxynema aestuarii AP17 TaxID=2064643 RepID=A0A6H1U3G6_9CYAN|nr:HNH endonuclease [Oxynema aestuarii]QIZ73412.1 HNH endonuclease [Oxynema aestuarii AP17]